MTASDNLIVEIEDRIALLTFSRPEVLNALNRSTLNELERVLEELRSSSEADVLILTGAGDRSFVAGADIGELADLDPLAAHRLALRGQALFRSIEAFPKPVLAAVNGFCLGGGLELAMACHMRMASEKARFGQPEVQLGLIPGYGGTQRLARLVGRGRALELILSGRTIDAAEASRIGLVNRVVPAAEVISSCRELAREIGANGPLAVRLCLEAVRNGLEMPLSEALSYEAALFALAAASEDMKEGTRAFLEKRKPVFSGR